MDRKKFILGSALAAFSLSAFGFVTTDEKGESKGDCDTTNDILGPFYRENAPERSDLTFLGLKGTRIQIKGKVFAPDCVTPLENAIVEIWHCDTKGEYDNDTDAYRHRGMIKTDKTGAYQFLTILPGKYLNGRLYRPAHVHFRVRHDDAHELISQIYFEGDPHITEDPWASQSKAKKRILVLSPENIESDLVLHFDIHLAEKV